ncbi:MAG: methyltransferase domain-containing protein [Candidatus Magasanikbacteria bacterium]
MRESIPSPESTGSMPKRHNLGSTLMREVSVGPVETSLFQRAEWMVESSQIQKYLADRIVYSDKLAGKVSEGLAIACIGAGKGHEMDEIDSLLPGSKIIGIDPHDHHTRPVKNRLDTLANDATYLSKNVTAENLEGVEDSSLDAVTLFFVLHHIEEDRQKKVFDEINRVLKDEGMLFIAEDLVDNEAERKTTKTKDRLLNMEIKKTSPHNYKSKEEWTELFAKHGFVMVEIQEQTPKKVRHVFFVLKKRKLVV